MHPPVPRSRSHGGSDLQWPPRPFRRGYLLLVLRFLRRIFSGIFVAFGLYLIRFSIFSGRPRWRSRPCLVPDVRPHAFCPFFLQGRRWWACSLLTFSFLTLWLLSIRVSRLLCYLTCSRVVLGFFRIGQSYTDLRVFLFHFEIDLTRDVYFFFSLIWSIGGSIFIEFSGKLKKKLVGITVLDFFFFPHVIDWICWLLRTVKSGLYVDICFRNCPMPGGNGVFLSFEILIILIMMIWWWMRRFSSILSLALISFKDA